MVDRLKSAPVTAHMRVFCIAILLLGAASPIVAADSNIPPTMEGKVFVGYQGWFTPQDQSGNWIWWHYGLDRKFEPGTCGIDMWPDTTDLDADERIPTPFRNADGTNACVFSSENPKTVERHFLWMRQYGIDGAFLQRFATDVTFARPHLQKVMDNVRKAAVHNGRSWAIMYDLSGLKHEQIRSVVMQDWKSLFHQDRILNDTTYLHHRGKPVVAVWGVGFNDGRQYSLGECLELVQFLKHDPIYGGNAVMLGVPYWWRQLRRDAVNDPLLPQVIDQADIISPWSVGRFQTPADAAATEFTPLRPDRDYLSAKGLDYLPVAFPGYSFHNASGGKSRLDQIPRQGGLFLWAQALAIKKAGANMVYIAMFDEINEGTAILKTTSNPPAGSSPFVTYNGLPTDHYLWLAGQIGRLLRDEIPQTPLPPARSSTRTP